MVTKWCMSLSSRSLSVGIFIVVDIKFAFGCSRRSSSPVMAVLSSGNIFLGIVDLLLRTSELDRENDDAVSESELSLRGLLSGEIFIGGSGVEFLSFMDAKSHLSS